MKKKVIGIIVLSVLIIGSALWVVNQAFPGLLFGETYDPHLTASAGGVTVEPALYGPFSGLTTEGGLRYSDFRSKTLQEPDQRLLDQAPLLTYREDFLFHMRQEAQLVSTRVFNEASFREGRWEELESPKSGLYPLGELPPGDYLLLCQVSVKGSSIHPDAHLPTTEWECALRLKMP